MGDTGPDDETRELVLARAGYRCESCGWGIGSGWRGYSMQHRIARGMGGTLREWINWASNLVVLCGSATTCCHGLAEARSPLMNERGFWLKSEQIPADTPIRSFSQGWVQLTDTGLYLPCPPPSDPGGNVYFDPGDLGRPVAKFI